MFEAAVEAGGGASSLATTRAVDAGTAGTGVPGVPATARENDNKRMKQTSKQQQNKSGTGLLVWGAQQHRTTAVRERWCAMQADSRPLDRAAATAPKPQAHTHVHAHAMSVEVASRQHQGTRGAMCVAQKRLCQRTTCVMPYIRPMRTAAMVPARPRPVRLKMYTFSRSRNRASRFSHR